jgi:ATP-dependent helicase HrpB
MGGEIARTDPMAQEAMLVVADIQGPKRKVRIARAAAIDPVDVELGFLSEVGERTYLTWDDGLDDLRLRVERRLGALDLGTSEQPIAPGPEITAALVERIVETGLAVLGWTDRARLLQARAALVAQHRPDVHGGPGGAGLAIDDQTLLADASAIFTPWLAGATGRADLEAIDLFGLLTTRLGPAAVAIDRLAPTDHELPGGRRITIDYTAESPRISIRAQQAYGMTETPRLLGGAMPLTVELLSPADRPIQVTSDLAGFWTGSWAEVRKDMAGRYPKHRWPQDPTSG